MGLVNIRVVGAPTADVIDLIAELENAAFGRGGLNEWHLPVVARHGRLYVIELDGVQIGAASLIRAWSGRSAFLFDLAIDEAYRNHGHGRALMEYVIADIQSQGFERMSLTVAPDNRAALKLYADLGFTAIDEYKDEYGPGENRILLSLTLSAGDKCGSAPISAAKTAPPLGNRCLPD